MRTRILVAAVLAGCLAMGCFHHDHRRHDGPHPGGHAEGPGRGYGPPPHAPAHGYRHPHGSRQLEYDARRGVYVVVGIPNLFWHAGHYHRRVGDRWQHSAESGGPWHDSSWDEVPPGLRGKGKGRGRGRGR
jgi:hypothetical protein